MTMPNFLIVGSAKSGTTALHTYLNQHPNIFMSPDKETNFFTFEGQRLNFQGPGDQAINSFSITKLADYQECFAGAQDEQAIGEACPLYLYDPNTPARIKAHLPQVKLIAILRNPVDRAYANYLHLVRDGREPCDDFQTALGLEATRRQQDWEWFWDYTAIGLYGCQLARYFQHFGRTQVRIFLYEDLNNNPQQLLHSIFEFLEVDPAFEPDISLRPNKSGIPKNKLLHHLLTKPNPLKNSFKSLFSPELRQWVQHYNLTRPPLAPPVRHQLQAFYRADLLRCQDLLGRDLSAWMQP